MQPVLITIGLLSFMLALFIQKRQNGWLRQQLETQQQHLIQAKGPVHQLHTELLEQFPYPTLVVSKGKHILATNQSLVRLCGGRSLKTLPEVDRTLSTKLSQITHTDGKVSEEQGSLYLAGRKLPRHFSIVSWPIMVEKQEYARCFCFFEQSFSQRRQAHQSSFELQLVHYLNHLGQQMQELGQGPTHQNVASLTDTLGVVEREGKAVSSLATFLVQNHRHLRHPQKSGSSDLVPIIRSLVQELGPQSRQQGIQFVSVLPSHCAVKANPEDLHFSLRSLLQAVLQTSERGNRLRLNILQEKGRVSCEILQPDCFFSENELQQLWQFGTSLHGREDVQSWQVLLAIVREVAEKQQGHLLVRSDPETGSRYRLTLTAA